MERGLKEKAIKGTFWTALQKTGISILSFLSNVVLARILSPEDYGCIGMLTIFIVIANALIQGGFLAALIQRKNTASIDFSTVFYWNLFVSFLLYGLLYCFSPYIASYYKIELLSDVLRVLGIVLLIQGFSAVQTTILRKNMQFQKLAKVNLTSSIISVISAIILAFNGAGVWSLVLYQIIFAMCNGLLLWSSSSWKPKLEFSFLSFKEMFRYGFFLMLSDLINNISDNIQGLIIGKKFDSITMGYYTQAKKMEEVPTQSISQLVNQVVFPLYAKVQDDKERLNNMAKNILSMMNYVNFPLMGLLIVVGEPLFIIIFSDKWIESVPYFKILCIAGIVNCMQSVNYQIVAASGQSKKLFYWNFVKRGFGILFILIGMHYGIHGILWGMVASWYFTYAVNACLAVTYSGYGLFQQIKDAFPIIFISMISSLISYTFCILIDNVFLLFVSQCISFFLVYVLLSILLKRSEFYEILKIIKKH